MEKVRPCVWPTLGPRTAKEQEQQDRTVTANSDSQEHKQQRGQAASTTPNDPHSTRCG